MNKQEMIYKIYEVVKPSTLISDILWEYIRRNLWKDALDDSEEYEKMINRDKILIWDVLDWIDKNIDAWFWKDQEEKRDKWKMICIFWHQKRKPIEEQDKWIIEYIYTLIYKKQLQSKLEEYIQEHILDYTSEMEIENENFLDSDKLSEKIKDYVESFIDDFIENPKYYKEEWFYNLINND